MWVAGCQGYSQLELLSLDTDKHQWNLDIQKGSLHSLLFKFYSADKETNPENPWILKETQPVSGKATSWFGVQQFLVHYFLYRVTTVWRNHLWTLEVTESHFVYSECNDTLGHQWSNHDPDNLQQALKVFSFPDEFFLVVETAVRIQAFRVSVPAFESWLWLLNPGLPPYADLGGREDESRSWIPTTNMGDLD